MSARIVPVSESAIAEAGRLIRDGHLVAFPTETVYGLGADATNGIAVARIFAAKDRPHFNPLIVHVADVHAAVEIAVLDDAARRLVARFWPGPLSLVVRRRDGTKVSLLASAGLDTVAVRAPRHSVAQALIAASGRPIAAPSANRSGEVSPTTAAHVAASLGDRIELILDGGACPIGLESTVLDLTRSPPAILRPGGVTEEEITVVIGPVARASQDDEVRSPGMLASHYAPRLPVRCDATDVRADEALLAFGSKPLRGAAIVRNLSLSGNFAEAAANLFATMRELDRPQYSGIAVMPIPDIALGRAINDRLRRAAAPRRLADDDGSVG